MEKINTRGGHPGAYWASGRALVDSGPHGLLPVPIFWYIRSFYLEKNKERTFGTECRRLKAELGRSTFALRWSDSAGDTSLREGEIETIVITNNPLIMGGPISINIFNSTISSQNSSSSLVSNLHQHL